MLITELPDLLDLLNPRNPPDLLALLLNFAMFLIPHSLFNNRMTAAAAAATINPQLVPLLDAVCS